MTTPTVFETISDQPEATEIDGLFVAAESQDPNKPTNKVSLSHLLDKSSEVFSYDGLIYKGVGNISDFAGQQLQEADKTNAYQHPDDSRQFYAANKSQAFPITIPADPSIDDGWALVNALTSDSLSVYTDIVYKASGGNSAIENMILNATIGERCSTGNMLWDRTSESSGDISDFNRLTDVFVEDFGADPSGFNPSYFAFDAAAKVGMLHAVEGSKFLIEKQVNTDYGWDLKGVEVLIPSDFQQDGGWGVGSVLRWTEPDEATFEQVSGDIKEGQVSIPWLSPYSNHFVYVSSKTEKAFDRNTGQEIFKQDVWLVTDDGSIRSTPSYWDFNSTLEVTVKPVREGININNPKFTLMGEITVPTLASTAQIERSGVTVNGGGIDLSSITSSSQQFFAFTRFEKSINNKIENQHTKGLDVNFCYPVYFVKCINNVVENCTDPTSWALVDGEVIRKTSVKNCAGSRVGWHYQSVDFSVYELKSSLKGVLAGPGKGYLKIRGLNHVIDYTSQQVSRWGVLYRNDYGSMFSGVLDWDGGEISQIGDATQSSNNANPCLVNISTTSLATSYNGISLGDIEIQNVKINEPSGDGSSQADFLTVLITGSTPDQVEVMDRITIKDVRMKSSTGKQRLKYADFPTISGSNYINKSVKISVTNGERTSDKDSLFQVIKNDEMSSVRVSINREYHNHKNLTLATVLPNTFSTKIYGGSCFQKSGLISGQTDESYTEIVGSILNGELYTADPNATMKIINCYRATTNTIRFNQSLKLALGNVVPLGTTIAGTADDTNYWNAAKIFNYKSSLKFE